MIAHYDIKPDNILVFKFPPVGHNCFSKSGSDFLCTFCKADHHNRVEVKLADLGIAAFVGPGGFRRRPATPGHTAPEAIIYRGKEALIEKVLVCLQVQFICILCLNVFQIVIVDYWS